VCIIQPIPRDRPKATSGVKTMTHKQYTTQELIQALIKNKLFDAACMYSQELEHDKVWMLLGCATDDVFKSGTVTDVVWELNNNRELYK
jgi:hypothetical protein